MYTKAKNNYRVLWFLKQYDVPCCIRDSLIFGDSNDLYYCGTLFATYVWLDELPVFNFVGYGASAYSQSQTVKRNDAMNLAHTLDKLTIKK